MDWSGGLLALGGVAFGVWLNAIRERNQWLRDERLAAYVSLISEAREMLYRGEDVQPADGGSAELREAMRAVRDAETAVDLVAPDRVRAAAQRVRTYFGDALFDHYSGTSVDPDAVQRGRELVVAFKDEARRSLRRRVPDWFR